jgi:DNA-binding MurR/RpiR family transcriptional regulator
MIQSGEGVPVAELTRQVMPQLSAAERKVARALLAAYPAAGLETVAELAERSGTSPPTVVRFVGRMGFDGYSSLQKALIHEVHESLGAPARQYPRTDTTPPGADDPGGAGGGATMARQVMATFDELPLSELAGAAALLAAPRRKVVLIGGRFSRPLVEHLHFHLELLRDDVRVLHDPLQVQIAVRQASRSQTIVAFDYRRYDRGTARAVTAAARRGASVILFTDTWLSPIASVADVVLPARADTQAGFDTLVPAMSLVEEVVSAVARTLGDAGRRRTGELERIREELDATPASRQAPPTGGVARPEAD